MNSRSLLICLTCQAQEISCLTNLIDLNLYRNELTYISPYICLLTKLNILDVTSNYLTSVPNEISLLTNLTTLYLGNNKLTQNRLGGIFELTKLSVLTLQINQLKYDPIDYRDLSKISNLANLYHLSIGENCMIQLPIEITHLTKLGYLSISGNPLVRIPAELSLMDAMKMY